jgi:serine/threonine-protein kinase HipA
MRSLNVYLCGNKTGVLIENDLLQLSFKYENEKNAPLSVNLPARNDEYSHAQVFPFFENLTPEGEIFEILSKDHDSGNKTFSILDRFGADCAGAVAFYKTTPGGENDDNPLEISSGLLAHIIDRLPEDPLLTSLDNPPRLSLAGAQSKFAVFKSGEKYYCSNDKHPSTHIIKITNKRFPDLLKNELFCMKLARAIQLDVPYVELKEAEGRPYLEIERYDRRMENETVIRIHQEDFCQALGIVSGRKYQAGGGASLRACHGIIEKFSDNLLLDIKRFMEWIVFNYLTGNTDAHAKNISFLYGRTGLCLAPFYDLLSTEVYPEKIIDHNMAMLINGKGKYDALRPKDFTALFEQLNLNSTNMMKNLRDKFSDFVSVSESLRKRLVKEKKSVCDEVVKIIKKRWDSLFG